MINVWIDNVIDDRHYCNLIPVGTLEKLRSDSDPNPNRFLSQIDWLEKEGIKINYVTETGILPNTHVVFPVELYWATPSAVNYHLNKDAIKEKNAKVLFWWPKEAWTSSYVINEAIKLFPKNEITFVTGNLKKPLVDKDYPNITYKGFDFWWFFLKNFTKQSQLNIDKKEMYEFTFFNRRLNVPRCIAYYRMLMSGRLKKSNHSFYAAHGTGEMLSKEEILKYLTQEIDNFKSLNYQVCDEYEKIINDTHWINWTYRRFQQYLSKHFAPSYKTYLQDSLTNTAYLDLISESSVYPNDDFLFITEKTYRSIANGNIFLIMGCPGTLKYLKSKGIETFSDLFDESYDDEGIVHWFDRWKIIEKNVDIWRGLGPIGRQQYYKKNFDKLIHNQNVLYSRNFKPEIEELFK